MESLLIDRRVDRRKAVKISIAVVRFYKFGGFKRRDLGGKTQFIAFGAEATLVIFIMIAI